MLVKAELANQLMYLKASLTIKGQYVLNQIVRWLLQLVIKHVHRLVILITNKVDSQFLQLANVLEELSTDLCKRLAEQQLLKIPDRWQLKIIRPLSGCWLHSDVGMPGAKKP